MPSRGESRPGRESIPEFPARLQKSLPRHTSLLPAGPDIRVDALSGIATEVEGASNARRDCSKGIANESRAATVDRSKPAFIVARCTRCRIVSQRSNFRNGPSRAFSKRSRLAGSRRCDALLRRRAIGRASAKTGRLVRTRSIRRGLGLLGLFGWSSGFSARTRSATATRTLCGDRLRFAFSLLRLDRFLLLGGLCGRRFLFFRLLGLWFFFQTLRGKERGLLLHSRLGTWLEEGRAFAFFGEKAGLLLEHWRSAEMTANWRGEFHGPRLCQYGVIPSGCKFSIG